MDEERVSGRREPAGSQLLLPPKDHHTSAPAAASHEGDLTFRGEAAGPDDLPIFPLSLPARYHTPPSLALPIPPLPPDLFPVSAFLSAASLLPVG